MIRELNCVSFTRRTINLAERYKQTNPDGFRIGIFHKIDFSLGTIVKFCKYILISKNRADIIRPAQLCFLLRQRLNAPMSFD